MTYTKIKTSRELPEQKIPNLPDWVQSTNDLKDDVVTVQTNLTTEIAQSAVGTTSLTGGVLTGAVAHGLASTPTVVILTSGADERFWVTSIGATNFIVNRSTGPSPGTVYYKAEI